MESLTLYDEHSEAAAEAESFILRQPQINIYDWREHYEKWKTVLEA